MCESTISSCPETGRRCRATVLSMLEPTIGEKFIEAATASPAARAVKLGSIIHAIEWHTCPSCRARVMLDLVHRIPCMLDPTTNSAQQAAMNLLVLGRNLIEDNPKAA